VLLLVCAQILFKYVAHNKELTSLLDYIKLIFNPFMIMAIALYAGITFLWVYILTKVPLSYAHPIQALAFPLVLILSFVLFKETIPLQRWIGVAVIVFGVFLVSR